jgi:hypothetical protein
LLTATAVAAATQTAVAALPPAPGAGETYVYPDPVPHGTNAHLVFPCGATATARVRLFNAAGEAAGEAEDGPLGGGDCQLLLPTASFVPGVYLYLLEATYGTGPPLRTPVGHFVVGRR